MADVRRLAELSTPTELAKEVAKQMEAGAIVPQPNIADVGAAPTQANFNALLAALRAAKVIGP